MRSYRRLTRRHFLGATTSAFATSLMAPSYVARAQGAMVQGRVRHLTAGASSGLPGVLVSNGVEVTRTDGDGAYALPMRSEVFIIKPAHWAAPLDVRTGLPVFWHRNNSRVGDLPASLDFILERQHEPTAFSALLYADPQPADEREVRFLRSAMDKMAGQKGAAFALALGDIAGDNLSIYPSYLEEIARIESPVWHLPGNHDHDSEGAGGEHRLDTWRAVFGPPTYAFEYGNALFIMLDNVRPVPHGSYEGSIGQAGLTFVRNLLSMTPADRLVVVCTHIPLTSSHSADPSCVTSDAAALLGLLRGRKAISFSGHMHTSEHHYLDGAHGSHHHQIVAALSGSWWSGPFDSAGHPYAVASDGVPRGWHVLSIDGSEYRTEFVSSRDDTIGRLIVSPRLQSSRSSPQFETVIGVESPFGLMVNLFDGGPRTRVVIEQDGVILPLSRVDAADPHTKRLYAAAGDTLKPWVRAEPSTHLWAIDENAFAAIDPTRAQLTVIDEFNRCRVSGAPLCLA